MTHGPRWNFIPVWGWFPADVLGGMGKVDPPEFPIMARLDSSGGLHPIKHGRTRIQILDSATRPAGVFPYPAFSNGIQSCKARKPSIRGSFFAYTRKMVPRWRNIASEMMSSGFAGG